jgi:hypothetical protein
MQSIYKTKIEHLNKELELLFVKLKDISDQELNRKPSDTEWSVSFVVQHLMTSEGLSLRYVQKKTSYESKFKPVNFRTKLRIVGLRFFQWLPFKFRAPAPVNESNFKVGLTKDLLSKQWLSQRQELAEFMENVPSEWRDKEIYKHPIAGRIPLYGMLDFFIHHFRRHERQIDRILKKVLSKG